MTKNVKRILLVANFILLILVAFLGVKLVNGQAAQVASERILKICSGIVPSLRNGELEIDEAEKVVLTELIVGKFKPDVKVLREENLIFFETNDQSLQVASDNVSPDGIMRVNCSLVIGDAV